MAQPPTIIQGGGCEICSYKVFFGKAKRGLELQVFYFISNSVAKD